jgi:UDP-N-acetylmuramoyl-tripeptide--D-alanyl-D-alanine ligase
MMTLVEAQTLMPGSTLVGDGSLWISRVHSDTRSLMPGDLFVALRGERFDGHDWLAQAAAAGACAALAERGLSGALPGLQVPDTLAGLQRLAAAWRRRFELPLIAVTGSNGKTTVTQMTAAILRAWLGDAGLATAGNFNNHIGVPLTLLRLRPSHRAAVLELGMNHPGEIAQLAGWSAPTVAVVNNAQREHQEFMDGVEAVARENGAVIASLPDTGTVVIPAGDTHTALWKSLAGPRTVLTFGLDSGQDSGPDRSADGHADVRAAARWDAVAQAWALVLHTPQGRIDASLHQAGLHNVQNALAAAAAAMAGGAPLAAVAAGLASFRAVAGRSQLIRLSIGGQPVSLVDDSYNANPDSVLAAIEVLAALPGPRWLLLGDMGEVGQAGPRFHAEVGEAARKSGIEHLWAAGPFCAHTGADRYFGTVAAMLEAFSLDRPQAASVLVKGSRFMKMEQVVKAFQSLQTRPGPQAEDGHAA